MTVAVIVISILLLSLITIVPVCTSIRGEKEREEKEQERLNRELREEKEFFLRLWEDKVVRCKDCKFNTGKSKCFNPNSVMLFPDDDDFCSYAERMTEYWEPEFTRTITGKIVNRTQLMLIEYDAGLYQIGPKQKKKKKKRRVKTNDRKIHQARRSPEARR